MMLRGNPVLQSFPVNAPQKSVRGRKDALCSVSADASAIPASKHSKHENRGEGKCSCLYGPSTLTTGNQLREELWSGQATQSPKTALCAGQHYIRMLM